MTGLISGFHSLGVASRALVLLSLGVALLLAVAVVFAAMAFAFHWQNTRKRRRWEALEAAWESDLLDYLSGDLPCEALLARVEPADTLYFVEFLSRYARRLRGSERERVATAAAPYLPHLLPRLRNRVDGVRARAVRTIALLGLPEYAPDVIRALDDESPLVAMTAARGLTRREQPGFALPVLERLDRFREWSPALLAAMLSAVGPDAWPHLRRILGDDTAEQTTRVVAADALRALHDFEAADVAAAVASRAGQRDLVAACLRLVGTCGSARHAATARALARSSDPVVRAAAIAAIGTVGDAADASLLRAAFDDPDVWVSRNAAAALLELGQRPLLEAAASPGHAHEDTARELLAARAP